MLRLACCIRLCGSGVDRKNRGDRIGVTEDESGIAKPSPAVKDESGPGRATGVEPARPRKQRGLKLAKRIGGVFHSWREARADRRDVANGLDHIVQAMARDALPANLAFGH